MSNAILNGHFRHLQGLIERFRAVVKGWENVAMNVDHWEYRIEHIRRQMDGQQYSRESTNP